MASYGKSKRGHNVLIIYIYGTDVLIVISRIVPPAKQHEGSLWPCNDLDSNAESGPRSIGTVSTTLDNT